MRHDSRRRRGSDCLKPAAADYYLAVCSLTRISLQQMRIVAGQFDWGKYWERVWWTKPVLGMVTCDY